MTIVLLNNAGHIVPLGCYFLNQLQFQLTKCKQWGKQKLADWDREDLILWTDILKTTSHLGVSVNNITFTFLKYVGTTYACKHSLRGTPNVCSTLWQNFWRDPSLDKTGHPAVILHQQLKKYIAEEPETQHQIALPLTVFLQI